jgi:CBS domain-containing protein
MAKVRDFMTTSVVTVSSDMQLTDAARLMRDEDVGVLPVVDGGQLKGVVTDRDLVVRGLADGKQSGRVGDLLTEYLVCLEPDDDEKQAEKLMSENDVRRLPVVENGRLVGMVSVGDLAVRANDKRAGKVMERTGPEG